MTGIWDMASSTTEPGWQPVIGIIGMGDVGPLSRYRLYSSSRRMPAVQLGDMWATRADVVDGEDVCPPTERRGYQDVSHLMAVLAVTQSWD